MVTKQVNLTLTQHLLEKAESYAEEYGFRNIQELATEALREKVFEDEYDESVTEKEIELMDKLLALSISKNRIKSEKDIMKALA